MSAFTRRLPFFFGGGILSNRDIVRDSLEVAEKKERRENGEESEESEEEEEEKGWFARLCARGYGRRASGIFLDLDRIRT